MSFRRSSRWRAGKWCFYFSPWSEPCIGCLHKCKRTQTAERIVIIGAADAYPIALLAFALVGLAAVVIVMMVLVISVWKHYLFYYSIVHIE